jgi:hypothetical protein
MCRIFSIKSVTLWNIDTSWKRRHVRKRKLVTTL